jgi:putative flippase GtrA
MARMLPGVARRSPLASGGGHVAPTQGARGQRYRLWTGPLWFGQATRFTAVGACNTALDTVLYFVLTHWLGLGGVKILAKCLSYTAGIVNSFHWNRAWTFHSQARIAVTLIPFFLASLAALVINAGAMYVSLGLFQQQEVPALCLATGITLLWNFSVNKFLVFRR